MRETFASHSSSLSKARLVRADPLPVENGCILRTHPKPRGQLGNTGLWPFDLRSIGRQFQDAPSDGRRSSFAFPGLRRFHIRSCHSTPGRRGHIRSITDRPWLFRPSQCCAFCPALRLGDHNPRGPSAQPFHVLHPIQEDLGPLYYTGSTLSSRRATLDDPDSTACPFGWSLNQPRVAPCSYSAYERSVSLTMSANSSSLPV